jgi:hypothetical protein
MGMTVWLNVRTDDKHESQGEDLSAILALQDQLDDLCKQLGVTAISTFFDETDLRYNMDDDEEFEESEDGWPASAATWHDAADLLKTTLALRDHLQSEPDALEMEDEWEQDHVIEDLDILIPGIEEAHAAGKAVHLLVVM